MVSPATIGMYKARPRRPPGSTAPPRRAIAARPSPRSTGRTSCDAPSSEGVRTVARDLGVSHEAVRAALRAAGRADLLADADRRRRLESAAPAPPPPPRKVPLERHAEVRRLCERHTQAEVAALFGVSQDTIWRIVHGRRH